MRAQVTPRPYLLTFLTTTGTTYPLSSSDAQRLIDAYPMVNHGSDLIVLRADDGGLCELRPATRGGGPAFTFGEVE